MDVTARRRRRRKRRVGGKDSGKEGRSLEEMGE